MQLFILGVCNYKTLMVNKIRKAMPQSNKQNKEKLGLSKFIKKFDGKAKKTQKDKQYVFKGFYERLSAIDVKHSHASLTHQSYKFDHLLTNQDGERLTVELGEDDLSTSNFIQLLTAEKVNNPTLEFKKVWKDIDQLAFSFPLVILNKHKIIIKLLGHLQNPSLKPVYHSILELLVALVKDLRSEIYQEFLNQILPSVISVLDAQNLTLLDGVFSFLSFSFKYLLKPIKEDIFNVYNVYSELLKHKNRFVRKFAAQSFSYVLRKVTFTPQITLMLFNDVNSEQEALGTCELLFEVVNGGSMDGLHSKSEEVLKAILDLPFMRQSVHGRLVVQYLYLKMVNNIDTQKTLPVFEILGASLSSAETLPILLKIFNDTIRLKFGKRVSKPVETFFLKTLTNLMKQGDLPVGIQCQVAETLSFLFYFKHEHVSKYLLESKFTQLLFQMDDTAVYSFFAVLMMRYNQITANIENIEKVLDLKSSNQIVEFSEESHKLKCSQLVKGVCKWTMQGLKNDNEQNLKRIELLVGLITASGEKFEIEIGVKSQAALKTLIHGSKSQLDIYILAKLVTCCKENSEYVKFLKLRIAQLKPFKLKLNVDTQENFVLKGYGTHFKSEAFATTVLGLFDMVNQGYEEQISVSTSFLLEDKLKMTVANVENYLFLTKVTVPSQKLIVTEHQSIFNAVVNNLSKNSRGLRIASFKILIEHFEMMPFKKNSEIDKDQSIINQFYTGDCNLLNLLRECEEAAITMDTEKIKNSALRRVQLMVCSGFVPDCYLDAAYKYAIGSLWVKFTPLHQSALELAEEIFRLKPQIYISQHLETLNQIGFLLQIGQDNEQVVAAIYKAMNVRRVENLDFKSDIYIRDCQAKQDFVQVKDFHYNLSKCLYSAIDSVLSNLELRRTMFKQFEQFMEYEHLPLHVSCQATVSSQQDVRERIVQANIIDSEDYKTHRRTSATKLIQFLELLSKSSALHKLSIEQSAYLISHLMQNLTTADDNLQKIALQCLLKVSKKHDFANATVKLPKYQKLLEGLCDDIKFKDMILIIAHGSQETGNNEVMEHDEQPIEEEKTNKVKGNIPKLAVEDRLEVLPVIIKLLFSKLLKKKGVINKKNFHTRLNIVYQFLSGLDPATEYPLFFQELLEPLGLSINETDVRAKLQNVSFGQFIQFIAYVEVIFKQVGSLLNKGTYLINLTNMLVMMLSQAKVFLGHLQEESKEEQSESQLYKYVSRQCKMCVRKGLKIVKYLYSKFNYLPEYMSCLSELFYSQLVADQLNEFNQRYVNEKAQLIEVLTVSWSQYTQTQMNYTKYPLVIPALMKMLTVKIEPAVFQCHLKMIKSLIVQSMECQEKRKRLQIMARTKHHSDDEGDQSMEEEKNSSFAYSELAKIVLQTNVNEIGVGLHAFWQMNQSKLKKALVEKSNQKPTSQQSTVTREKAQMTQTVRDLTFIMSELSSFLTDASISHSFLEMIVSLVSNKQILTQASNFQRSKGEDLLMFACQSICNLLGTSNEVDTKLIDRVFSMFLDMQSRKARQLLASGLYTTLSTRGHAVSEPILMIVVNLNTVKKGTADIDFDLDKVLNAIKQITKYELSSMLALDLNLLIYGVLYLLANEEFSVREYAEHALTHLLPNLSETLIKLVERQLVQYIRSIRDEMIMKTVLSSLRSLVMYSKTLSFDCMSKDLQQLVNQDNQEDFFTQILSMQLPQRLKALRKLQQVEVNNSTFTRAIMPLVDYLIFDVKNQMENRRNTVRYSRDQNNQLQEEALQVYTSYARRLNWGQYMALVRKLLYKIEKATRKGNSVSAEKNDQTAEKVVTKCLCKVLDGFDFPEVPDAVAALEMIVDERYKQKKTDIVEYSDFLKEFVGDSLKEVEEEGEDVGSDSDSEKEDVAMEVDTNKAEVIQNQLLKKVLPLLQRHLIEVKGEKKTIRAFVAVSIAKVIRRLPVGMFKLYLQKLVNLIVTKGLREKDLNTREKARKALVKVINEVSPRFLTLIFQEMQNNLNRGFQLHVYLYTVHYVLNHLTEEGSVGIQPGQITSSMITLASDLLLREMFGDLLQQRTTDSHKKHIKESKAQKAMPIYEVFAQYIDFQKSFLDLIQPIMKVLEENPTLSAIQQTEDLLARVSNNILKNKTMSGDKLLVFLKQIIEKGVGMSLKTKINDEKATRDYGAGINQEYLAKSKEQLKMETYKIDMKWNKNQGADKKTQEICGRVLANFGLQTLRKALKVKGLILAGDEAEQRQRITIEQKQELVTKLDPFVQPLLDSFKTFYNPIIVQTLSVMINVIHLGLPSFKILLKKFLNRILKLFSGASNSDSDFLNSLFKCTGELIKTYSVYADLSEIQLKTLVLIIKSNVNNFSTQTSVFQCLRSILHRKFECADLYDLMQSVQDLMVTNVQQQTRQTCAQIFLQFITEYPMEQSRLDQHINHMLKNLTYFDPEGRLQLLDTLQVLIERMPIDKLETWTDLMFLTLFLRLVNENSTKCREKVTIVIRKLISKSNSGKLIEAVFQMENENLILVNGKLQLLSLFADIGKLQKADIKKSVQLCHQFISQSATKSLKSKRKADEDIFDELTVKQESVKFLEGIGLESEDEDDSAVQEDEADDEWSNTYFSIVCIENMMAKCNFNQVFAACSNELKRDIVTLMWRSDNYWVRLSSQRVIGHLFTNAPSLASAVGLKTNDEILKMVYQFLSVLNFSYITQELSSQLTRNLVFVVKQMTTDIPKVFKKASFIGRRIVGDHCDSTEVKLKAIISFYTDVFIVLKKDQSQAVLEESSAGMLELICRTYTDEQLPIAIRDISAELVDLMSASLDKDSFIKIFNEVQMHITKSRQDRKMKSRLLTGTQQGQVIKAKKRIQKTLKKKEKHRDKVLQMSLRK